MPDINELQRQMLDQQEQIDSIQRDLSSIPIRIGDTTDAVVGSASGYCVLRDVDHVVGRHTVHGYFVTVASHAMWDISVDTSAGLVEFFTFLGVPSIFYPNVWDGNEDNLHVGHLHWWRTVETEAGQVYVVEQTPKWPFITKEITQQPAICEIVEP